MGNPWENSKLLFKKTIRYLFRGKRILQPLWEWLHWLSLYGMNIGGGSFLNESGELWVIDYFGKSIQKNVPVIIFDIGAHVGGYASAMIPRLGTIEIYCFEPSKKTFEQLVNNMGHYENVKLFNFGFGDKEEFLTLYSDQELSGLASVYYRKLDHFGISMRHKEEIHLMTLDNFCKDKGVRHINFLKLDVEGHELKVLLGAKNLISSSSIDFIQFEFGPCNIDSKTYLRDFFYLLDPNYRFFRILRNGLAPIKSYQGKHEAFITTNYLAISRKMKL